jgi:hypothetical protein
MATTKEGKKRRVEKVREPIKYETVLNLIETKLKDVEQWQHHPTLAAYEYVTGYAHEAQALIELLEDHNCGITGGYDRVDGHEQRRKRATYTQTLAGRYKWLKEMR